MEREMVQRRTFVRLCFGHLSADSAFRLGSHAQNWLRFRISPPRGSRARMQGVNALSLPHLTVTQAPLLFRSYCEPRAPLAQTLWLRSETTRGLTGTSYSRALLITMFP